MVSSYIEWRIYRNLNMIQSENNCENVVQNSRSIIKLNRTFFRGAHVAPFENFCTKFWGCVFFVFMLRERQINRQIPPPLFSFINIHLRIIVDVCSLTKWYLIREYNYWLQVFLHECITLSALPKILLTFHFHLKSVLCKTHCVSHIKYTIVPTKQTPGILKSNWSIVAKCKVPFDNRVLMQWADCSV